MINAESQMRIAKLRAKPDLTLEDMKEVVRILREGRVTAQTSSAAGRGKTAKAAVQSADELLNELERL